MAADWDSSSGADAVTISETSASIGDYELGDIDPDLANYDGGNDPDTAYSTQGTPDSPDRLDKIAGEDLDDGNQPDYGGHADEYGELPETGEHGQLLDMWGDTDPDAANYADLDGIGTGGPDGDDAKHDEDRGGDADADRRDEPQQADAHADQHQTPAQERIDALEAENADARQQIADANQKITAADQKIAELQAKDDEKTARLDRFEQLIADLQTKLDSGAGMHERAGDKPASSPEQAAVQDAASAGRGAALAERQESETSIRGDDALHGWRRVATSDNFAIASAVFGATDTVSQFVMNTSPWGTIGLSAMTTGLISMGLQKVEQKRKDKRKS